MRGQLLNFFGFCFVFTGIILFCVILGGYSSFWRAQKRIETSRSLLTDACQKRLDLVPGLIEITKKSRMQQDEPVINQTAKKAQIILQQVISREGPVEIGLIKEFEISQSKLTFQLRDLFSQLEGSIDKNYSKQFADLKKLFFALQDELFVTGTSYNDEVNYFNMRITSFLPSLIAKLFGFNKMKYINISKDLFLPAKTTFSLKTS